MLTWSASLQSMQFVQSHLWPSKLLRQLTCCFFFEFSEIFLISNVDNVDFKIFFVDWLFVSFDCSFFEISRNFCKAECFFLWRFIKSFFEFVFEKFKETSIQEFDFCWRFFINVEISFLWLRLFENDVNNSKKKLFFVLIFFFEEKNFSFSNCLNVVIFFQNFSKVFLNFDLSIIHFDEYFDDFLKNVFVFLFFVAFLNFLLIVVMIFKIWKISIFNIFTIQKWFDTWNFLNSNVRLTIDFDNFFANLFFSEEFRDL